MPLVFPFKEKNHVVTDPFKGKESCHYKYLFIIKPPYQIFLQKKILASSANKMATTSKRKNDDNNESRERREQKRRTNNINNMDVEYTYIYILCILFFKKKVFYLIILYC